MDYVPALRGHIGDWEYYVTIMKLADAANRIQFAHQLHPHRELDQIIQRELTNRVTDMTRYLLGQSEHFYGALIVAVYGGSPSFHEVGMAEHPLLDDPTYPFGLIKFDGSQQYFALDGQHRLASIKDAIEKDRDLGKEEIAVIFVPHYDTPEGLRRTRRLFTTVNRYARPTAAHVNYAMDEDDGIAIVTRRLIREHILFASDGRVKIKGKSIAISEEETVSTLSVVYDMNENFLDAPGRNVRSKDFKQFRPSPDDLEKYYEEVDEIWDGITKELEAFRDVAEGKAKAGYFRRGGDEANEPEGHLLFRPVGQIPFSLVVRWGLDKGLSVQDVLRKLSGIDWRLGQAPWRGTVWRSGRMVTTKEMQALVSRLIAYMIGFEEDEAQLVDDYRREMEDDGVNLPPRL